MKNNKKSTIYKVLLTVSYFLITGFSFAQQEKIDIKFLGNCGFFLTDGKVNLYVDFPYKSGSYGYMTYDLKLLDSIPDHSIFLFTHGHADHYNKKLFKQTHQKLYAPWPVTNSLSGKRKYTLKALNDSIPGFKIIAYKTKHRFSLKHCSYLIVWNGKRIFISGDVVTSDTISTIKNLDLVIAPTWLVMDANRRDLKIDTKKIIICHHRNGEVIENRSKDKILIPVQGQTFELK